MKLFGLLLLLSFGIHLCLGWMGFNPTDDGVVLAGARRLLNGEIPHLDYISIRPVGSSILHMPALFFGPYAFWLSRWFVVLQLVWIAYFIYRFFCDVLSISHSFGYQLGAVLVVFFLTAHNLLLTAWTTVDGIFFCTMALYLMHRNTNAAGSYAGCLCIGIACLMKQVFVPFMLFPLLWKKGNKVAYLLLLFAPLLLYLIVIVSTGGYDDLIVQFTARTELMRTGFMAYKKMAVLRGALLGVLLIGSFYYRKKYTWLPSVSIFLLLCVAFQGFVKPENVQFNSFNLFGCSLVVSVYCLYTHRFTFLYALSAIQLLAWCSSISLGYNCPVYLSGGLVLGCVLFVSDGEGSKELMFRAVYWVPVFCASCLLFFYLRYTSIYRETKGVEITYALGGVFPGMKGIYTNERTFTYLNELKNITDSLDKQNSKYSIMPAFAAFWATSVQPNPLVLDWINNEEIPGSNLRNRAIRQMQEDKQLVFILSKVEPSEIAREDARVQPGTYYIQDYVLQHATRIRSYHYYELYQFN
ncbi:MAG: hypothetical protein V4590_11265 [Bacteroidota bacterium]